MAMGRTVFAVDPVVRISVTRSTRGSNSFSCNYFSMRRERQP